jgi:transcriptional regulator with XRE-family HTH domain
VIGVTSPGNPARNPARPKRLLRTLLGDALRRARLDQGRTLAEVARAARVSMPYLSELERGLKEASSEVLAAVCDALHVELPDLLAEVAGAARDMAADQPSQAQIIRLDRIGDQVDRPAEGQPLAGKPATDGPVCLLAA